MNEVVLRVVHHSVCHAYYYYYYPGSGSERKQARDHGKNVTMLYLVFISLLTASLTSASAFSVCLCVWFLAVIRAEPAFYPCNHQHSR